MERNALNFIGARMQRNSRLFTKAQFREQFGAQLKIGNKIRDLERNF